MTTPDFHTQWAERYIHAPGASVAVYEDGSIDSGQVQDKELIGVYRLSRFADESKRQELLQEWAEIGIEPEVAQKAMRQAQALPPAPEGAQARLDEAAAQYREVLMEAQRRVHKSAVESDGEVKRMPILWLGDAPQPTLQQQAVFSPAPDTSAADLQKTLDEWWKRAAPGYSPIGPKTSIEEQAFPFSTGDDQNRGSSGKTPPKEQKKGASPKNTWNQVLYYRQQPIAERRLWIKDLLEDPKCKEMEFGDLMRWLRIIGKGWRMKDLAKALECSTGLISHVENFYPDATAYKAARRHADYALSEENPFLLPQDETGAIAPWVRELIEKKLQEKLRRGRYEDTRHEDRRDAMLTKVEQALADYREGRLAAKDLPNVSDVLDAILPIHTKHGHHSYSESVIHSCGLEPTSKENHARLSYILKKTSIPTDQEIAALARYAGCGEQFIPMLQRLPRGVAHHFSDNYRQEMTEPEFQRVFSHPEDYEHSGLWLKALREAQQRVRRETAEIMGGIEKQAVDQHEKIHKHRSQTIENYLAYNPFGFPVDESGKVKADIAQKFREVMSGKKTLKKYNLWPGFTQAFERLGIDRLHPAIREDVTKLIADIQSQTAMEDGEGICDFTLDGRSYTARRTFNGELRFAPETVEALKNNPTIAAIREKQGAQVRDEEQRQR